MQNKIKKRNRGYTIIETMISVSLFLIIVMAGLGALLNANLLHRKSKDMRSIMDNLSFVMEDMSRNLRTGYNYYCSTDTSIPKDPDPQSCEDGGKLIFFTSALGGQYAYYIGDAGSGVYKVSGGGDPIQLTSDEVNIDEMSSFTVVGAEPASPDDRQPLVTIRLVGTIESPKGFTTPFSLQTSISQRNIDI